MYAYTSHGVALNANRAIWHRNPLQPFSDVLTPFSYSVLAEITGRAWFRYYERLGVRLPFTPRNVIRQYQGRPYLNVKWLCEQDAAFAGLEPLALVIDGSPISVCTLEKPNFLTNFRHNRNQRRLLDLLDTLASEIDEISEKARHWLEKVTALDWTQAEILQIMEEIERFGVDSLMVFYAARHNLERAYNGLLRRVRGDWAEAVGMVNSTLSDLNGLPELALTHELLDLADLARRDETILAWLKCDDYTDWAQTRPGGEFGARLQALMGRYGHWATGQGEMANPRWFEQPDFLFKGILACAERGARQPARVPSGAKVKKLLECVDGAQRVEAERLLEQVRRLTRLQSRALHAYAYILAGTRLWALAAGHEAMSDGRLRCLDDVFLFELEELKEMMTGERNVTGAADIRATADERRAVHAGWCEAQPGVLLCDDVEAFPVHHGLPGVMGKATGPLRRQKGLQPILCADAVIGARQIDSGWAPMLPVAGGILAATGTPFDPIVAAARVWHVPAVVALGDEYDHLVDGAQTTLDGATGAVRQ